MLMVALQKILWAGEVKTLIACIMMPESPAVFR
jgi:hypothetical protein